MAFRVAGWNVARAISDDERVLGVGAGLAIMDADVVVLSEAGDKEGRGLTKNFARDLGYIATFVEYQDDPPHPSVRQYVGVLVKKTLGDEVKVEEVRLRSRNALRVNFWDPDTGHPVELLGVHGDDRNEQLRMSQFGAAVRSMSESPIPAKLLVGDLNAMHGEDRAAQVLSSAPMRAAAHLLPHPRARSLATRLTGMADGETMHFLTDHIGFRDADTAHAPTKGPAQLDHIMYNPDGLSVLEFHTLGMPKTTDHKAIFADMEIGRNEY